MSKNECISQRAFSPLFLIFPKGGSLNLGKLRRLGRNSSLPRFPNFLRFLCKLPILPRFWDQEFELVGHTELPLPRPLDTGVHKKCCNSLLNKQLQHRS